MQYEKAHRCRWINGGKGSCRKGSLGSKAEGGDTTVVAFGRSAREICFNGCKNHFCFINSSNEYQLKEHQIGKGLLSD